MYQSATQQIGLFVLLLLAQATATFLQCVGFISTTTVAEFLNEHLFKENVLISSLQFSLSGGSKEYT